MNKDMITGSEALLRSLINEGADTIFIPTSIEYSFLSSTTVREIASLGGDISKFVVPYVEEKLKEKYNTK